MNNLFFPFYIAENEFKLLLIFQKYIHNHQNNLLIKSSELTGAYGSFPHTLWDGGRTLIPDAPFHSQKEIEDRINFLNSNNIKYKATFTNCLLTEEHLNDKYCNMILKIMDNGFGNEVIINSLILENYLQDNYPNLKLTSSITKGHDFETFKQMINKNYHLVVAYPTNKTLNYIQNLSIDKRQAIEIILGSTCLNCPIHLKHYKEESLNNLLNQNNKTIFCPQNFIEKEKIILDFNLFQQLNITHFKITGRSRGASIEELINRYCNTIFKNPIEASKEILQEYNSTNNIDIFN